MPWSRDDYPQSWKHLTEPVRGKAIDIANALLEEGEPDSRAIPIATAQAEAWAERRGMAVFTDGEREGIDKGPRVHVVPRDGGAWAVQSEGRERAADVFDDKRVAVARAKQLAMRHNSDWFVHDRDGRISRGGSRRRLRSKKRYHVSPHDDGWQVKGEGDARALAVFDTQRDAIERGREAAERQDGTLIIHGADGRIRDTRSYDSAPARS